MKLAINGGNKVRTAKFPAYNFIGAEEEKAVVEVLRSGVLSKFLGSWSDDFYGGKNVQELESKWKTFFNSKHAISVNSNSSGILCALAALGLGPGDEVIVSPYTMSVSASAVLVHGSIPVFIDIDPETFCIEAKEIEKAITNKTKAIIAVDIFGHPYNSKEINALAKKHGIKVIEDCAQAPFAKRDGVFAGNLGDIGIFSLNYHKHIHTGEGGIIVTNDDDLAERCRLIRNHAEAVVDSMGYKGNPRNLIGYNFRMTEIEAAIGICQLDKLEALVSDRQEKVAYLEAKLSKIKFLKMPKVDKNCTHAYYVHSIIFDEDIAGVSRTKYIDAVRAELEVTEGREDDGVLIGGGYVKPLYKQSLYQNLNGVGERNFPFDPSFGFNVQDYKNLKLPVVEHLHYKALLTHELMRPGMSIKDLDDVAEAFIKVAENLAELK